MANFTLNFTNLPASPIVSGDQAASLDRLSDLIRQLKGSGVANQSSAPTVTCLNGSTQATGTVTFAGLATAADTVTINGIALTCAQKNATGTATFSTIVAGNTVTINGTTFTAATTAANALEFTLGASDTTAAAALAAAVNAYGGVNAIVTATSALGVVTFRAVTAGTGGNSITLTKVGAPVSVSGATLANGAAAANNAFDPGNTAATAATAFSAAVNASSTAKVSNVVVATVSAGVVTLTALTPGTSGNVTLTKSGTNIAVSGATLTGGTFSAPVTLSF